MLNSMPGELNVKHSSACIQVKFRRFIVVVLTGLILSSCSTVNDLVPDAVSDLLPGKAEKAPLVGERRAVLKNASNSLGVDAEASTSPFIIPQAYVNTNWAQPGGVPSNAVEHPALGAQPKRLWRTNAGSGSSSSGRLTASPIVVGNFIFVLDTRATVRAFSATNGGALWSVALTPKDEEDDEGFGGGVAAGDGKVFAVTGFGSVVALDMASGKIIWRRELGVPIRSAPTAKSGRVYATTVNNEIFALNASDGETAWKFRGVSESAGLLASTSPAVSGGYVIVPYSSGDIVAFREADGAPVWTDSLTKTGSLSSLAQLNDISGRPVVYDGKVYAISHGGRFSSLDLKTGARVWGRDITGVQTPWVAGGAIFVLSLENKVMALSRNTGKVRWIVSLDDVVKGGSKLQWSGPVLAGGRLWLVSSKGQALTLSPQSGKSLGSISVGGRMFIAPIVANNTIYFLTDSADLIAMR